MRIVRHSFCVLLLIASFAATPLARPQFAPAEAAPNQPTQAEQLFALANQARAAQGLRALKWDPALSAAALQHCQRMVAEGPIAHRYGGEPDVTERAGQAGAHFSLIEENVALGPTAPAIHSEWMNSPGHRANLLNGDIDRVGIAVVAGRGELYAVSDFARAVQVLTQPQVEAAVSALLRANGVVTFLDPAEARAYCAHGQGIRGAVGATEPSFRMRWQNADLSQLPQPLLERLAPRQYRKAAVGSCAPQDVEGSFTTYRVAALLY
jgi:hypothetical protein